MLSKTATDVMQRWGQVKVVKQTDVPAQVGYLVYHPSRLCLFVSLLGYVVLVSKQKQSPWVSQNIGHKPCMRAVSRPALLATLRSIFMG